MSHVDQRSDVPKTRIGGSGAGTPSDGPIHIHLNPPPEAQPACLHILRIVIGPFSVVACRGSLVRWELPALFDTLLQIGCLVQAFFLHLTLISLLVLARSLLDQCRFKRYAAGRFCLVPLQGPTSKVILAWGDITQAQRIGTESVTPKHGGIRPKARVEVHSRLGLSNRIALGVLALMPCPTMALNPESGWNLIDGPFVVSQIPKNTDGLLSRSRATRQRKPDLMILGLSLLSWAINGHLSRGVALML